MAASVLQRCLRAVKVIHKPGCLSYTARRCLLSAAYTDTTVWEAREKDPRNMAQLAKYMDGIYERNFPVSSLTIARFIDNISSREEVDQADYYLYKFRHSPNCWYLRDWTVHSWIRQCLKYGARDKALHTLKNKVQYGIFPDEFTFNLLIDSFIKDEDFKGACSVVEEVMLQESFDLPSTQLLSLYAVSRHLASKPTLEVSEERALGATLLNAGLKQNNTTGLSAQLLGYALLGKVEQTRGIHRVFRDMPLLWRPGYLGRGLDVMETLAASSGDLKLSKETLDHMEAVLQELSSSSDSSSGEESSGEEEDKKKEEEEVEGKVEEDKKKVEEEVDEDDLAERAKLPQYVSRFKSLSGQLSSQGRVESESLLALVSGLVQRGLSGAEQADVSAYRSRVEVWEEERRSLALREVETRALAEQQKQASRAAKAATAAARQ